MLEQLPPTAVCQPLCGADSRVCVTDPLALLTCAYPAGGWYVLRSFHSSIFFSMNAMTFGSGTINRCRSSRSSITKRCCADVHTHRHMRVSVSDLLKARARHTPPTPCSISKRTAQTCTAVSFKCSKYCFVAGSLWGQPNEHHRRLVGSGERKRVRHAGTHHLTSTPLLAVGITRSTRAASRALGAWPLFARSARFQFSKLGIQSCQTSRYRLERRVNSQIFRQTSQIVT